MLTEKTYGFSKRKEKNGNLKNNDKPALSYLYSVSLTYSFLIKIRNAQLSERMFAVGFFFFDGNVLKEKNVDRRSGAFSQIKKAVLGQACIKG